jgi:hypothetical protein
MKRPLVSGRRISSFGRSISACGGGINAKFVLTGIRIQTPDGWRVAERHSSRREKALAP